MIPTPWVGLVLALGTFRIVRLIGWDDLPPIYRLRAWVTGEKGTWNKGDVTYTYRRPTLAHFLGCGWCQGFWVGLVVYVAWLEQPTYTLYALAIFALNAAVGLLSRLDS